MRERVLTVHGIWTKGAWQEDVARVFAPHFDCISVKYPNIALLGPLNLVLEPYVLLVLGLLLLHCNIWHASDWVGTR